MLRAGGHGGNCESIPSLSVAQSVLFCHAKVWQFVNESHFQKIRSILQVDNSEEFLK